MRLCVVKTKMTQFPLAQSMPPSWANWRFKLCLKDRTASFGKLLTQKMESFIHGTYVRKIAFQRAKRPATSSTTPIRWKARCCCKRATMPIRRSTGSKPRPSSLLQSGSLDRSKHVRHCGLGWAAESRDIVEATSSAAFWWSARTERRNAAMLQTWHPPIEFY